MILELCIYLMLLNKNFNSLISVGNKTVLGKSIKAKDAGLVWYVQPSFTIKQESFHYYLIL